ncbi:MAG TPA: tRNA uridine-5-carboxymethylaminomethyl(34) synthesis GTPase MnmE, partial [Pyrinomonadaceae bacterium]|nr:tRNA uridine-5-carboxymethylaminomethyl(34) synthesis GTPase MnmE [Pyrinomonadaceae bacterium]
MADTIVALSTPLGRSGLGVVRMSGPGALEIAGRIAGGDYSAAPRMALLKTLKNAVGENIDEAVLTYFKAPNSFTGEDIIEISCHGSPVVLRSVIDECLAAGARLADPGEFSLRALANGRMDLAEAEAIRDLIDAQSGAAARQALRQMKGELSHELQPIKDKLLNIIVVLESALEFVEDDLPAAETDAIIGRLENLGSEIERMAGTYSAGKLIREGIRAAIVGRPNVGNSSLFNALIGSERAIVTEIPGTTRDQLHERFTFRDIPISLIDTAGLRETEDTIESIGVERSRRAMTDADMVLVMLDASEPLTAEDLDVLEGTKDLRRIIVLNKIDKSPERADPDIDAGTALRISAKTGEG